MDVGGGANFRAEMHTISASFFVTFMDGSQLKDDGDY